MNFSLNMFLMVILVGILINNISCQKNHQIESFEKQNYVDGISIPKNRKESFEERQNNILSTSRALSTQRTFVPSLRVILLEVSFMAISIYLVNSLENFINKPKTTKSKNKRTDEDIFKHFKNIVRNLK